MQLSFLKYLGGLYNTSLNRLEGTVQHAVIQSLYDVFDMGSTDLGEMELEVALATADGRWLDAWGDYFGVFRHNGEQDDAYRRRIIEYVIDPKTTIPAIKDHLASYLNEKHGTRYTRDDIDIREPWKYIGKYSQWGTLSHTARFFSGDYYTHAVIEISMPETVDEGAKRVASEVKAAGVRVLWSTWVTYDIISDFNTVNDVWARYLHWIQMETLYRRTSGLVLSSSTMSGRPMLSGRQVMWFWTSFVYEYYAYMWMRTIHDSYTITDVDLMGEIDYYTIKRKSSSLQSTDKYTVLDGKQYYISSGDSNNWVLATRPNIHVSFSTNSDGKLVVTNKSDDTYLFNPEISNIKFGIDDDGHITATIPGDISRYVSYTTDSQGKLVMSVDTDYLIDNLSVQTGGYLSVNSMLSGTKPMSGGAYKYTEVEEKWAITDKMIASLSSLNKRFMLSRYGLLSGSTGILSSNTQQAELYHHLMDSVNDWLSKNDEYSRYLQSPIQVYNAQALWLVPRNRNWLWDTPLLTHEELYTLYTPEPESVSYTGSESTIVVDGKTYNLVSGSTYTTTEYVLPTKESSLHGVATYDASSKTLTDTYGNTVSAYSPYLSTGDKVTIAVLSDLIDFEEAYYSGYLEIGDQYQAPIEVVQTTK